MSRAFKHTRSKDYSQWSTEKLQEQIRYYQTMEHEVKAAKSRRSWKQRREEMEIALAERTERSKLEE